MSLYIGNLSSRTLPDELERVFRRFGRCTIQIKEKYGFVVYDYPASAERALKTLKGTRICGESINLSWSKQQPSDPQRFFVGGNNSYEPLRRRYLRDNTDRRPGTSDRRAGSMKLGGEIRKGLGSSVFVGESNSHRPYDLTPCVAESDCKNIQEDDIWEDQVVDPMNENYAGNSMGFDRYEPHGDETNELDRRQHISPPVRSPSVGAPQMFEKKAQCDKEPSTSKKRQRSMGRGDSSKKRNRRDYWEGAKGLSPSSVHSDYTSSRLRSRSRTLKSLSGSSSPSKSISLASKNVSVSSSLRSSPLCHSGSKTFDSRSRSKSKSHNSLLLPLENNSKDYVDNDVGVDYSKDLKLSENIPSTVENEFKIQSVKSGLEDDTKKDLSLTNDEDVLGDCILTRPESDISARSKMSSEEMCMVLKHYGLQCPEEKEKDLPVETFFGSARLWPWDMIYYRRLKKGSISAENYSRRVAQNQEFGIVDKYIRGSSGWGGLN